ncbi:hypothetical protein [Dokdonella sp.]|uniref:hypothetical protein n=1 Tax=Dokdonella sp. TaxID=2291710 RepID=UPI0037849953
MNTPRNDEPWVDRAVALLQQSADGLDAATLSRLNRARQAALAQPRHARHLWWGVATTCAVALVLAVGIARRELPSPPALPVQDSGAIDALAADDDNPDMVDDLDFYAWLDAQQHDDEG